MPDFHYLMGCSPSQGDKAVPQASRREKSWKNTCRQGLITAFYSYRTAAWYLQAMQILEKQLYAQENTYTKAEKWENFLHFSLQSPYLSYSSEKSEEEGQTGLRNLFDMLNSDFNDPKHPISVLISAFVDHYSQETSVLSSKSQAAQLLEISTMVLKFCSVLGSTVIELYSTVALVLQGKRADLDGLVMERMLRTGLGRRMEALAEAVWQNSVDRMQATAQQLERIEELRKTVSASISDFTISEITSQFKFIAQTGNFHFRRQAFSNISEKLRGFEDTRALLCLCMLRAAAPALPAQLQLTKLLLAEAPDVLDMCLAAIDWLTL